LRAFAARELDEPAELLLCLLKLPPSQLGTSFLSRLDRF
jgi:hypothetical protein